MEWKTSIKKIYLLYKHHYDISGEQKRVKTNYTQSKQYRGKKAPKLQSLPLLKNSLYFFPIFFQPLSHTHVNIVFIIAEKIFSLPFFT